MIYPLSLLRLEGMLTMSTLAQLKYFKKLTTLDLILNGTDFPLVILSSLSKLPSLAKFKLVTVLYKNERSILGAESSAKPMVYSFSNLENLEVRGNVSVVLSILQSIYGERLLRVTLGLGTYSTNNAIKACLKRSSEMAPQMLFYSINIHGLESIRGSRRTPIIPLPLDMFAPLPKNYGQLRSLTIQSIVFTIQHFCDLFDRARVGFSWSALEILKLQMFGRIVASPGRSWLGIDEMMPLSSLSMLAASCPKLHTLELYIYYPLGEGDRENKVLENCIQSSQPTDHKLTHLKIVFFDPFVTVPQPGDIVDAVTVSRFIDHVFPNVQNVDISDWEVSGVRREWYSEIKAMMENYRDVRERTAAEREPIIPN
jgi:hypothetical protein